MVVARNKKGESEKEAVERVEKDHPGKDVQFEEPDTPPPAAKKGESGEKERTDKATETKMEEKSPVIKEVAAMPDADGLTASDATLSVNQVTNGMPEVLSEGEIAPVPSSISEIPDMPTDIIVRNSFPTDVKYEISGILRHAWFTLGMSIGDISTRDKYRLEFKMMALRIMEYYSGVYVDFDKVVEQFYRTGKITSPSQAGFDYNDFASNLDAGAFQRFTTALKDYHLPSRQIVDSDTNFFGLAFEAKLIKDYHRINQEHITDLDSLYNMFRSMEDRFYFLAPLDPQLDRRFVKAWYDPRLTAYYDLFRNNRFLSGELYQMFRSHVKSTVTMTVADTQQAMGRLQNAARIRVGQSSKWTAVPGSIKQNKAIDAWHDLFTLKLVGERAKAMMRFRVRQFDPVLLIECLMAKLMMSSFDLDEESIINIDNYLNQWFLPICPKYNANKRVAVPASEKTHTSVNYLSMSLAAGAVQEPFISFLWTRSGGRGWNTSGGSGYVKFDRTAAKYMARTDQFLPFGGIERDDWNETFPQLEMFNQVVDELARGAQRLPGEVEENSHKILASVLTDIAGMSHRISELAYYGNLALRKASMNNIGMPSHIEGDPANDNFLVHIPTGSLLSMIYLIDGEHIAVNDFGLSFYRYGRNIHRVCNMLVERYHFVEEAMVDPRYTRTERLEKVLSMIPSNPVTNLMKEAFGAKPNAHDVKWPSRDRFGYDTSVFARKLALAEKVLLENAPLYGFATHFYFNPNADYSKRADSVWQEYWMLDPGVEPDEIVDWDRLINLIEFNGMKSLVQSARRGGKVIRFDIPVKIGLQYGTPPSNQELAPIDFKSLSTVDRRRPGEVSLRDLNIYYRTKEEFYNSDAIDHTADVDPEWLVDVLPVMLQMDKIEPRTLHSFIKTYNEGWTVVDEVQYVHFIRKTG
jgi:hypothetical protein